MKASVTLVAGLIISINCFSQSEIKNKDSALLVREVPYRPLYVYYNPGRPSAAYMAALFEDEAKVLPDLYATKNFAGMRKYVDSIIQKSGGFWSYWYYETAPPIFCVQTLLAIEANEFNEHNLSDTGFRNQLVDVARIMRQMNRMGSSKFLTHNGIYNYNGFTDHFITFVRNWAKDLLATHHLTESETFLCKVFDGEIEHPVKTIRSESTSYKTFDSLLVRNYKMDRNTGFFVNFLVSGGVWIPTGNLQSLGNHMSLGYNVLGFRDKRNEYDLYFASRFINTSNPYYFTIKDTATSGKRFYSGYYGFDYTRYIVSTPHFETGIIGAVAVENIQFKNFALNQSVTITSPSFGAGLRMNYVFSNFFYVGASCKYNFLNYLNSSGTNLQGNAISADIYCGINLLIANKGKK